MHRGPTPQQVKSPPLSPFLAASSTHRCGLRPVGLRSPDAQRKISAAQNYPYFWFHFIFLKEFLGLCRGFDERNQVDYKAYSLPPILYFYGADKGFKFHSEVRRPPCYARAAPLDLGGTFSCTL